MQNPSLAAGLLREESYGPSQAETGSAVSWPAIWGGAFAATALSFILLAFGAGMGFAFVSPLPHEGMTPKHFTYMSAVWLVVVQWVASGLGGYLTGRLRTKWQGVHTHEVFFRDTAHGFLTWSVSTLVGALLLILGAASIMGDAHHEMGRGANFGASSPMVDSLLRPGHYTATDQDARIDPETRMEIGQILMQGIRDGNLSDSDKAYVSQIVATHAGVAPEDVEKKIDDTIAKARQTEEQARKTAAGVSLLTLLSMFIGAFVACIAAAIGGQERDMPYPREV
jgi:hypothetical protein